MKLFLITTFIGLSLAQTDDLQNTIDSIFVKNASFSSFFDGYEEVTAAPLQSLEALTKCGEGDQRDKFVCVRYYNCDATTNTIIENPDIDGSNVFDIRAGSTDNICDHYLDKCCQVAAASSGSSTFSPMGTRPIPVTPTQRTVTPTRRVPIESTSQRARDANTTPTPQVPRNDSSFCGIRNNRGVDFTLLDPKGEAEFGEFPWMVAILRKTPGNNETLALCGGSLIGPGVVLTGAHCVKNVDVSTIKIRAGEWDTQTTNERIPFQERNVAQKIVHEHYLASSLYNDLALLILDRPLAKVETVGTVCLPPQDQVFNSKDCFATGWGKDKFGQEGRYSVILKKLQLPMIPVRECSQALKSTRLGPNFILHDSFICAGGQDGLDTCTGDGGSPLVCPDPANPGRYYQVGIVAWGIGCGVNGIPGVYVNVPQFRTWIDTKLQAIGIGTQSYTA